MARDALELPVLRLGLAGFSAPEQADITKVLRGIDHQLRWEFAPLAEADAWCVNGSRITLLPDGTIRIAPGLPSNRSIRITLQELDWPVAFSTPTAAPEFEHECMFDPQSQHSVEAMLRYLEGRLRPLIVQFYVASKIVEMHLDMRSSVYHVSLDGKLCAVISQRSGIGVWPIADPARLPYAVWSRRPDSADAIPNHFVRTDFSQLIWEYAMRTERDCLPTHYRTSKLYLRRPPRLPVRLLTDQSLLLVRELGHAPGAFAELRQRTGMSEAQLSRHLAALYMVGAITADPRRVPAARLGGESSDVSSAFGSTEGPAPGPGPEMTVRLKINKTPPPPGAATKEADG